VDRDGRAMLAREIEDVCGTPVHRNLAAPRSTGRIRERGLDHRIGQLIADQRLSVVDQVDEQHLGQPASVRGPLVGQKVVPLQRSRSSSSISSMITLQRQAGLWTFSISD
jgi:hypothetical protein